MTVLKVGNIYRLTNGSKLHIESIWLCLPEKVTVVQVGICGIDATTTEHLVVDRLFAKYPEVLNALTNGG